MKSKFLIVIAVVVLVAVGYFVWKSKFSPEVRAIRLVKQALIDPDSAKFDQVRYISRSGAVCGGVNSKNRMGGYVGMIAFIVDKTGKVTFEPMVDTESGSAESRVDALQQSITFLELVRANCTVDSGES
ncbi:hypothetical protein [Thermomonas sp.]|uniref:hypothetical protein n=1 Tax=Thermomonas sp. TaxID=1971895 RepID=UPI002607D0CB|nr:hypothetical protein [Thermomonas sp.]